MTYDKIYNIDLSNTSKLSKFDTVFVAVFSDFDEFFLGYERCSRKCRVTLQCPDILSTFPGHENAKKKRDSQTERLVGARCLHSVSAPLQQNRLTPFLGPLISQVSSGFFCLQSSSSAISRPCFRLSPSSYSS